MGLQIQRKAIRAWAKSGGHRIVASLSDEGVSGKDDLDNRPGLAEAFALLESGRADALVIYRMDRLARKLALQLAWTERIEDHGRRVISVTEPDVGEDELRDLVRQILGAIAQYERATIVRRMQGGRQAKRAAGGYAYGAPPFGQRSVGGVLVPDAAQQATITRMLELRGDGASIRAIAAAMNSAGLRTSRGGTWCPSSVSLVLERAA